MSSQRTRPLPVVLIAGLAALLWTLALPAGVGAEAAPDYAAERLDGSGSLSLGDLRGEVVMLNLWATWCGPCRDEMPELQALSDEYGADGLNVIGVSIDVGDRADAIRRFTDELGVRFTILRDPDAEISRAFRTSGVPETILIDRAGNVAYQWKGELEAGSTENRAVIEAALASDGAVAPEALPRVATIGFVAAFTAGLLSMLSPCVLPLLPTYATYITGVSVDELRSQRADDRSRTRRVALRNGLFFVGGFSLVFIAMGASASAMGELLHDSRDWIARIGGIVLLVMGVHLLGVVRLPALDRIVRPNVGVGRGSARPLGTLAVGMAFGAGWTPCIGPALASILTLAAATASMGQGIALLTVYSLGLAIPFLLGTVLIDRFMRHRGGINAWLPSLERVSGILVIAIGVLMVSGAFTRLAEVTSRFDPLL